ncbi:MAG: hypothetical protein Q8T09_05325 [Candidatus Melainabacteria bacterium]|nr:hypothetical protein [Candidatus Melainabacteria bacterium]
MGSEQTQIESAIFMVKLLHAGLSVAGFALGVAILYFFRPGITVRTAIVAGSALTLISSILLGGDLFAAVLVEDRFTLLRRLGWFAFGLLFGAGRGDRIVNWIRPPVIPVFVSEPVFKSEQELKAEQEPKAELVIDEPAAELDANREAKPGLESLN